MRGFATDLVPMDWAEDDLVVGLVCSQGWPDMNSIRLRIGRGRAMGALYVIRAADSVLRGILDEQGCDYVEAALLPQYTPGEMVRTMISNGILSEGEVAQAKKAAAEVRALNAKRPAEERQTIPALIQLPSTSWRTTWRDGEMLNGCRHILVWHLEGSASTEWWAERSSEHVHVERAKAKAARQRKAGKPRAE